MIRTEDLVKRFGSKLAVDGVSFSVEPGEILGFLGPNGAGKSTTMRMITGFLEPTAGRVTIGDHDMQLAGPAARALIGYLPENAPAYPEMTVVGFLSFMAQVRGLHGSACRMAVDKVIETCFLQGVRHQTVDTLSKGFRHRTCFAQAILHDPPVLVLDEPTDGLDPNQKSEVRSLIKRMGEKKTIILSTHILEEVDACCSRLIIIDRGKLVFNGAPSELRARSADAGSVRLRVAGVAREELVDPLKGLADVRDVSVVGADGGGVVVDVLAVTREGEIVPLEPAIGTLAAEKSWAITQMVTQKGRLEDVFHAITVSDTAQRGSDQ